MEIRPPFRDWLSVLAGLALLAVMASGDLVGAAELARLTLQGINPQQEETAAWAADPYAQAGLDLPRLGFLAAATIAIPTGIGISAVPAVVGGSSATRQPVILTPDYGVIVSWALDLYADAGLELTDIEVGIYDDQDVCGEGRTGLHRQRDDGYTSVVLVCAIHDVPRIQERSRRHVLLHELAHAWAERHLSEATKQEFLAFRGLEAWSDNGTEWGALGAEHAAEIIAWNIADRPYLPHVELTDRTCDGLAAGYPILTGRQAPHVQLPICD